MGLSVLFCNSPRICQDPADVNRTPDATINAMCRWHSRSLERQLLYNMVKSRLRIVDHIRHS